MDQQEITIQLWEYIDGTCDAAAMAYTAQMIAENEQWKNLYEQLIALHSSIPAHMELEQPSMRFTKNVMEAVSHTAVAPAARKYLNPSIIRIIAGFFILSIVAAVIFAITNWQPTDTETVARLHIPKLELSRFYNSAAFNILIWTNTIIGLLLLDTLLRRKRGRHTAP